MTSRTPANGHTPDRLAQECAFTVENAEAFALGALEERERSRIQQHVAWCGPCRRAGADARRVTALLPFLALPATPSPRVRAGLFARIAQDQARETPNLNPWAPASSTPSPTDPPPGPPAPTGWQRWTPALVAPLAIALIVLAAWAHALRNEVAYLRQEREEITLDQAAGSNAGMQLYALTPSCPTCDSTASGHFGGDPSSSVGLVVAWNLDPRQEHEVWCVDKNGEKWLVTELDVAPSGQVVQAISFPQPLGGYRQIYVARNTGSGEPRTELLVALDQEAPSETPDATAPDAS